jgi:uncharacterized protein
MTCNESRLIEIIRQSPNLMTILKTCRDAGLPDWRLVSGAIYGTVFNYLTNRAPEYGIKDYDIAYFDPDTSYDAEDVWIKKIDTALPENLRPKAEVRNQARVHLWFKDRFGSEYEPLKNTDESLLRYLCFAHAIAIRLEYDDEITIYAPFGLEDIFSMTMRHNPARGAYDKFIEKSLSIKERWTQVTIIEEN